MNELDELITRRYMVTVAPTEQLSVPVEEYLRRRGWRTEEITERDGITWVSAWAPDGGPLVTTSTPFGALF